MATSSKEPRDVIIAIKVVILGAMGISQENTACIVHCGKQTVGRYQQWYRELPYERARSLVADDTIRRFTEEEFPKTRCLDETEIANAVARKPTTDSVLLYYGHSSPEEKPGLPQGPLTAAQSMNLDLLRRHWDRLRELTATLRDQSKAPTPETIFTSDVCRQIHVSVISKTPLLPPTGWGRLFEAPLMLRQSTKDGPSFALRFDVELESLFPQLSKHLGSEDSYSFLAALAIFASENHGMVSESLKMMEKVTEECPRVTQAGYAWVDKGYGLCWELPAYLCRYMLAQYSAKPIPWITPLHSYAGGESVKLVPLEQYGGVTLAREADYGRMERHQSALFELVTRILKEDEKTLTHLSKTFSEIATVSYKLRKALTGVIERGDYRGSCDICRPFLEALSLAPDRHPV